MSVVDLHGVKVSMEAKARRKPGVEMSRDLILIGLRAQKLSFREIGRILKISHVAAYYRWKAIPEDAKRHYTRALD